MDNELFKALFRLGWIIVEQHKKLLQFNGNGPPRSMFTATHSTGGARP